ncbi:MAG: DUF11 domain-containing protein, partial [Anaerolineales bacterium]|nr:DUF11 domain-containing protein [Anaerolineales bacterium]
TAEDNIGGIAYDTAANQLLVFGTAGATFPVADTTPTSDYYQGGFGGGTWDIFVAILSSDLTNKVYATYIGGAQNDYLGQTGDLIGQGHVIYSPNTGLTYLATTVHSTLPLGAIGTPPGKDKTKSNPDAVANDVQTIFAFNINSYDYGDAPASYEGSPADAANSAMSATIRIGATVDAEAAPASGDATGDDSANTGSADDEDGIATLIPPFVGESTYSSTVSVLNNSGAALTLQGWADFNLNGVFEAGEYASVSVPANAAQQNVTLNWSGLPALTAGQTVYMRLRLNDGTLTDSAGTANIDERSISRAGAGEVEDYAMTVATPTPILSKTFTPSTILAGEISQLEFAIMNPSAASARTDVSFSDIFPASMIVANPTGFSMTGCGSPTYATPQPNDTSISFTGGGTIAAGGTCTVRINVTSSTAGVYVNDNLAVSSSNGAGTTTGATLTVNAASLSITKSAVSPASGAPVQPGDPISYSITVTNTGTVTQNNIAVTDNLPAGTTYVSGSVNGYRLVSYEYLDNFTTGTTYNQTYGASNWSGQSWTETGDDGVSTTGLIRINDGLNRLELEAANGGYIERVIPGDLTGKKTTLVVDYGEIGTWEASDGFYVDVWD